VDLNVFSVRPLCSLCLGGGLMISQIHHGDTENTEDAQRMTVEHQQLERDFLKRDRSNAAPGGA
jgi:hypothetical protein